MLQELSTDVFRLLLKFIDPSSVEALIKTHPSLRGAILLDVNEHRPIPLAGMKNMNAYIFNIFARPISGLGPRQEIERRTTSATIFLPVTYII